MTGRIIQLPGNPHREIQLLLPWYVTRQLDAADDARVAAHVAQCPECLEQLETERRLDAELTRQPADVEQGWAALQQRIDPGRRAREHAPAPPPRIAAGPRGQIVTPWARPKWLVWGVGAQLAFAALLVAVFVVPDFGPARFTALSAVAAPVTGNVVVIFRPETSEQLFRETLRGSAARLVDGPTSANAYVLQVPAADRTRLLAKLRAEPAVVLAEPVDSGRQP